jgi:hypothetical protein
VEGGKLAANEGMGWVSLLFDMVRAFLRLRW